MIQVIINMILRAFMVDLAKKGVTAVVNKYVAIKGGRMEPAFERALAELLNLEGGYSDHAADRGGRTNWGVTEVAARRNGYDGDMRDYPLEHAREVYLKDYWDERHIRLDFVVRIADEAVAAEIFEQGVNTGVVRTAKRMQRVLNVLNRSGDLFPDLVVDGWLGSAAREAMAILKTRGDLDDLLRWLNIAQGAYYFALLEEDLDQDQEAFARGWAKRVQTGKG